MTCLQHQEPERTCTDCAIQAHAALCLSLLVERQTGMPRWRLNRLVDDEELPEPRALRRTLL